jgi:alkylhydroperoxidase/carboxymuconolactone decarboxylase family protein YurZ
MERRTHGRLSFDEAARCHTAVVRTECARSGPSRQDGLHTAARHVGHFRSRHPISVPGPRPVRAGDVVGSLWERPQLSRRDRSVVTVAILIARGQGVDLPHYMNVALDSGVTPRELSEVITHLAFYRVGRTR